MEKRKDVKGENFTFFSLSSVILRSAGINSKSEARSSNQYQMFDEENSKQPSAFDHFWQLVIRVCFGFRYLNFGFAPPFPNYPCYPRNPRSNFSLVPKSNPEFMAQFGGRKERIVNGLRSGLERRDERSRAATHKSETPVPVHPVQPGPGRVLPWGACASRSCSPG